MIFRLKMLMYYFIEEEQMRNLYVATSRAKQKLDLIFICNKEEVKEVANSFSNINSHNDIARIAMKLKVKPIIIGNE